MKSNDAMLQETEFIRILRKNQHKITPQRLSLIRYVCSNPGHFTAEEAYRNLKKTEPTITLATVYNILRIFTQSGILNTFESNGSRWFETNNALHVNFICENCGLIEDYEASDITPVLKKIRENGGTFVSGTILVRGYCKKCAKAIERVQ